MNINICTHRSKFAFGLYEVIHLFLWEQAVWMNFIWVFLYVLVPIYHMFVWGIYLGRIVCSIEDCFFYALKIEPLCAITFVFAFVAYYFGLEAIQLVVKAMSLLASTCHWVFVNAIIAVPVNAPLVVRHILIHPREVVPTWKHINQNSDLETWSRFTYDFILVNDNPCLFFAFLEIVICYVEASISIWLERLVLTQNIDLVFVVSSDLMGFGCQNATLCRFLD